MCDFSFIIPVYNSEKVIGRCLDSILGQTYHDYEVIIVDDGSADKSADICRQYASKMNSWEVISQNNSGPSKARNTGLKYAKGNYICFVDSDDWIENDYLEVLQGKILKENPDVIFFGFIKENKNGKTEQHLPSVKAGSTAEICLQLSDQGMFGYTWVKCFAAKAIGEIRFDESIDLHEDEVFACNVVKECRNISILPQAIYHYYVGNSETLISKTHLDYCRKVDTAYLAWSGILDQESLIHKADKYTSICIYYGLERDIKIRDYFRDLKHTQFFKDHSNETEFDQLIRNEDYLRLNVKKAEYQFKQAVHGIIHKR